MSRLCYIPPQSLTLTPSQCGDIGYTASLRQAKPILYRRSYKLTLKKVPWKWKGRCMAEYLAEPTSRAKFACPQSSEALTPLLDISTNQEKKVFTQNLFPPKKIVSPKKYQKILGEKKNAQ